jgi:phenylacetate-CoA ligase
MRLATNPRELLTIKYTRELERSQWLSQEELQQISWQKLKKLLDHAYTHVPFYCQRFQELGLTPQDIQTEADFRQLPFLTKEDIRQHTDLLLATNFRRNQLEHSFTSGSTGTPVVLYHDQNRKCANFAAFTRSYRWFGGDPGDKIAWVWGRRGDLPKPTLKQRLKPERWMDAFNPNLENLRDFAEELSRWQPDIITGYANVIYLLAEYIANHHITGIRPKFVQTTAMSIWPHEREFIKQVFQCPISDRYSSHEAGAIIAVECPQGNRHIFSDCCYVEIIKDGLPVPPGEVGEVIITPLYDLGMPLLRYRMTDVASLAKTPCPCGRGLPLLDELLGRTNSIFTLPSGRLLHGLAFREPLDGNLAIRKFRIHQYSKDRIEAFLQKGPGFNDEVLAKIHVHYSKLLRDEPVEWKITITDDMPTTVAGKLLVATSDVPVVFNC